MNCKHCKETFVQYDSYSQHFGKKHRGIKPWVCFYCNFASNHRSNFHRHMKNCNKFPKLFETLGNENVDFITNIEEQNDEPIHRVEQEKIPLNINILISQLKDNALDTLLGISGCLDVTDKRCFQIINMIKNLFAISTDYITQIIEEYEKEGKIAEKLKVFLKTLTNPFSGIDTEYRFKSQLKHKNLYKEPIQQQIYHTELELINQQGTVKFGSKTPKVVLMPIFWMLEKFLSCPNVLSNMSEKLKKYEEDRSGLIQNYVMGRNWQKKKENFVDKKVFPFFLYSDELQVNNPLGSKYNKVTVVNLLFPLLEDWQLSRTDFIFPVMLFDSNLVKKYGNEYVYQKLIIILNKLAAEGLEIELNGKTEKIYLVLGLLTGDNLGVSSIMDFPSYSHTYYCRFCTMPMQEIRKSWKLDRTVLRQIADYDKYVLDNSFGMTKKSIFNQVDFFHVLDNPFVDVMHDIQEGVLKYGLQNALGYFIDKRYLNIETINRCIKNFSFGEIDNRNKISAIYAKKQNVMQNDGKIVNKTVVTIKASAHEMRLLMKYFVLIFGQFIDKNDKCWKYVKLLENITDLCFSKKFSNRMLHDLNEKIELHNKLYIEIFKDNLKPKHHNGNHYVDTVLQSGPLVLLSCIRAESKHRDIKVYTNVSQNRQNVSFSASKKLCIMYACFLRNFEKLAICRAEQKTKVQSSIMNDYEGFFNFEHEVYTIKKLNFKGTDYKIGFFICKNEKLFRIEEMLLSCSVPYLKVTEFYILESDEHLNCKVVGESTNNTNIFCVEDCSLPFNLSMLTNGKTVFKCNYNI